MSLISDALADALYSFYLKESEGKVDNYLQNEKKVDEIAQAIQKDPEIEDKNITPKDLLMSWDQKSPILSKNIQWLAKQYAQGLFYAGDLYKLEADLGKFERYKQKKDLFPSADLNQYDYKTLRQELDKIPDEDVSHLGTSARKKAIEKGKDEVEQVYEDNQFIILIPKTEAASRYWGKGTNWCTAADSESNMFNYYNNQGPLYILISKSNPYEKYQFHFPSRQFMDAGNSPINVFQFAQSYPHVKAYFANTIKDLDRTNVENWAWIDNTLTYEDCEKALANRKNRAEGYSVLQLIPEKFKDYNLCETAVIHDGGNLQYVPKDLIDYNMCLQAVDTDGIVLDLVPERFRDEELCLTALENDPWLSSWKAVPEKLKNSKDFCMKFIEKVPTNHALRQIPEEFKDKELYKTLIKSRVDDISLYFNLPEMYERFEFIPRQYLDQIIEELKQEMFNNIKK